MMMFVCLGCGGSANINSPGLRRADALVSFSASGRISTPPFLGGHPSLRRPSTSIASKRPLTSPSSSSLSPVARFFDGGVQIESPASPVPVRVITSTLVDIPTKHQILVALPPPRTCPPAASVTHCAPRTFSIVIPNTYIHQISST
jgi:hypothetical protein